MQRSLLQMLQNQLYKLSYVLLLKSAHWTVLLVKVPCLCSLCCQRRDVSSVRRTIYLPLVYKHLKLGEMPRRAHLSIYRIQSQVG